MLGSSLVWSHGGCVIVGFGIGFWINIGHIECHCPDCVVTLTCPAVFCTTGSIELSLSAILGLVFSIAALYLAAWLISLWWPIRGFEAKGKTGSFDSRSPTWHRLQLAAPYRVVSSW